jgi:hypothetical protein
MLIIKYLDSILTLRGKFTVREKRNVHVHYI